MKYHILNGDALKEQFPVDRIDGDLIIVRECLLEGDVSGADLETFRNNRAAFIQKEYGASREEYFDKTVSEFELIFKIPEGA
ncbi:MAG: DUF1835 domain-containing protein, partial [bacterium]|nr:DUF1835 domain-containing protein [bacterium]